MDKNIRRLGIFYAVLIGALVLNLTWLQVMHNNELTANPDNRRRLVEEYGVKRGRILTSDGVLLAESLEGTGDIKYTRHYPQGVLYDHVTGYDSPQFGRTGHRVPVQRLPAGQGQGPHRAAAADAHAQGGLRRHPDRRQHGTGGGRGGPGRAQGGGGGGQPSHRGGAGHGLLARLRPQPADGAGDGGFADLGGAGHGGIRRRPLHPPCSTG